MSGDITGSYAAAFLNVAKGEGVITQVGDELLRFSQAFEGSPQLQQMLGDLSVPPERRLGVVTDLLGDAHPVTSNLVSLLIGSGHTRELPRVVATFLDRAAAEEGRASGEVRTAHPLSLDQQQRITAAIEHSTKKKVELKFLVDPSVLGGVVTRVGDIVIDGTVRSRLDALKDAI